MNNPNLLLENRFGISDLTFDQTNLLCRVSEQKNRPRRRGIVGVRDTGEANAIIEIINNLPFDFFVMASERGEEVFTAPTSGYTKSRLFDPMLRIQRIRGDVAITGMSGIPSIELAINVEAHRQGKRVFGVEDFAGAYLHDLREILYRVDGSLPDALLVGNEWAKQVNMESKPEFPSDRIFVTGFPALDLIARADKAQIRKEVREKLGAGEEELLIGWFGQVTGATVEHLEVFLKGLKLLDHKNYRLAVRLHPRDDNPKSVYDDLFSPLGNRVVYANRDVEPDANRVIAALDLGVNERSTVAMQGAAWGIPFISLANEEIIQKYGVMLGLRVGVIEDGTSPAVYREEDMAGILERTLFDEVYRKEIFDRMNAWKSDGRAGQRAAKLILEQVSIRY